MTETEARLSTEVEQLKLVVADLARAMIEFQGGVMEGTLYTHHQWREKVAKAVLPIATVKP